MTGGGDAATPVNDDVGTLTRWAAVFRRIIEADVASPCLQGLLSAAQMMEREAEYLERLAAGDEPELPAPGERVRIDVGDLRPAR